jgi:hypothetical protein
MQSDRPSDARETFPWIFEFPKNSRGPVGLFDQRRRLASDLRKLRFALDFAGQIYDGRSPRKARENAAIEFPDTDDRILQRYLCEVFGLKKLPRTVVEWAPVIDRHFGAIAKKVMWPSTA